MSETRIRSFIDVFPVAGKFTISRGSRTEVRVVRVEVERNGLVGRGECVPYARYGETPEKTLADIAAFGAAHGDGLDRMALQTLLPPGAARNGIDCALWDLEARQTGCGVAELAGVVVPDTVVTAYTISLDTPEAMAAAARKAVHMPLLKLKLGADGDADRLRAVREAVPSARLVVDANEGWTSGVLEPMLALSRSLGWNWSSSRCLRRMMECWRRWRMPCRSVRMKVRMRSPGWRRLWGAMMR